MLHLLRDLSNALTYFRIFKDIIKLIAQYMKEEGYNSSRVVFLEEAGVKLLEKEEHNNVIRRIQKALLGKLNESNLLQAHLTN